MQHLALNGVSGVDDQLWAALHDGVTPVGAAGPSNRRAAALLPELRVLSLVSCPKLNTLCLRVNPVQPIEVRGVTHTHTHTHSLSR